MVFNTTLAIMLFKEVYMTNLKITNVDSNNSIVTIELFDNTFEYNYEGSNE